MERSEDPAVTVEGDWSPAQARTVSNKLLLHFQSRKRSNGGECRVELEDGSPRATVYFTTAEVRDLVLAKKDHEIVLDNRTVKLHLNPAAMSAQGDQAAPQSHNSRVLLLDSVSPSMSTEMLTMVVESVSGCDESRFHLEMLWDSGRAVVTFEDLTDAEQMLAVSDSHPKLQKHGLKVEAVEAADSIRMEHLPPNVQQQMLEMFCEKNKVLPQNIKLIPEEDAAIITFIDPKVADSICVKKNHMMGSAPVQIYPYLRTLETALYGAERPPWKLPAPITEKIHHVLWMYLQQTQQSGSINDQMRPHFCSVDLQEPETRLRPLPGLLRQKNLSAALVESWAADAREAFRRVMSQLSTFECSANATAWKAVQKEVYAVVKEDAVVVLEDHNGVLVVAGQVDNVNRLRSPVENLVSKAMEAVERQTNSTSTEVSLPPDEFFILQQEGLQKASEDISPEMKLSYDEGTMMLTLTGLPAEVSNTVMWITEQKTKMSQKLIHFSQSLLDFLTMVDRMDITQDLFTSQGIRATFSVDGQGVSVVGSSSQTLVSAEAKMSSALSAQTLDVEDQEVLNLKNWADLNQELLDTHNIKKKSVLIQTNPDRSKVHVAGFLSPVEEVTKVLHQFLSDYTRVEESHTLPSLAVSQFIYKKKSQDWTSITKDKKVSVQFDQRRPEVLLSGPRLHVQQVKSLFTLLAAGLFTDTRIMDKPGVEKFFKHQGSLFLSNMMTEFNCVVLLKSKVQEEDAVSHRDVFPYRVQASGGVLVCVDQANISSFMADAVVSTANETLQHGGGVARALLRAAGPQLQTASDEYIAKNGRLRPGDAVVTPAFGLPYKHVIHAVLPQFSRAEPDSSVAQLKAALSESLKKAELHGCASVVLPALGSTDLCFPSELSAQATVQAVREHCHAQQAHSCLKELHLLDGDGNTVRALAEAVRREFDGSGAIPEPSQEQAQAVGDVLPAAPRLLEVCDQLGISRNSLRAVKVTTKGLTVLLCEGNIQQQKTHIIVNTISTNLNLAQGAVSTAILAAGGPGLQDAVYLEAGAPIKAFGSVVVTDGCRLACRKVFHVICPCWDGKGSKAEKMLRTMVRFCLQEAEKLQMSSLCFPALGTGILGFPRDVVSRILLEEIHSFSSKSISTSSSLKEVLLMLHPSDTQNLQCFTKEFVSHGGSTDIKWEGPVTKVISQSERASAPPSLVSSPSPDVHQMRLHHLTLHVLSGDITKDSSDVIVNSSNPDFTLRNGVSKAILDAAGQSVERECSRIVRSANYKSCGMIITSSGNLPSRNIIHTHVPSEAPKIQEAVYSVLKICEEKQFSSVCFPALGTGRGGVEPSEVADAMVKAVVEFEKKKKPQFIRDVKFLIFQPSMIFEFHQSLMKKQPRDTKFPDMLSWFKGTISSWLRTSNDPTTQQDNSSTYLTTHKFDPTVFELCGEDKMAVHDAAVRLEELLAVEQVELSVGDPNIRLLSRDDWDELQALQERLSVSITANMEQEDQEPRVHLQGLKGDVLMAESEVSGILRRVERVQTQRRKAEQLSRTVQWQYVDRSGKMVSFDSAFNLMLEEGRLTKTSVNIKINEEKFKADPETMKARSESGWSNVSLIRTETPALPPHWSHMQGELVKMFPVISGSSEFVRVEKELNRTGFHVHIFSIMRVQNPTLYQSYELMKNQLQLKNKHSNNERLLFHGTSSSSIHLINSKGFNRSYAGMHGAMFGNGSYFAVDPAYSAKGYALKDFTGKQHMYLARVLVGDFTVGKMGLISPPAKTDNTADLYDSVTDRASPPTMFVVFNDIQAYPEYLITFTS